VCNLPEYSIFSLVILDAIQVLDTFQVIALWQGRSMTCSKMADIKHIKLLGVT